MGFFTEHQSDFSSQPEVPVVRQRISITVQVSQHPWVGAFALDGAAFKIAVLSFTSSNMTNFMIDAALVLALYAWCHRNSPSSLGICFLQFVRLRLCQENPGKITVIYN